MSLESAMSFLERIKTDDMFRAEHEKIKNSRERQKLINGAGYEFTDDELSLALDNLLEDIIKRRLLNNKSYDKYKF